MITKFLKTRSERLCKSFATSSTSETFKRCPLRERKWLNHDTNAVELFPQTPLAFNFSKIISVLRVRPRQENDKQIVTVNKLRRQWPHKAVRRQTHRRSANTALRPTSTSATGRQLSQNTSDTSETSTPTCRSSHIRKAW